jgi:hypothetical protein
MMASVSAADRAYPGELLRLVADGLAAAGLQIRPPGREDSRLLIACTWARCTLSVSDRGLVAWECYPLAGRQAAPKQVADLATVLLTGRAGDFRRRDGGHGTPGLTLKGVVGLELKARGLDVELEVHEDREHFEARSLIVATNPAATFPATVQVCDDGSVTWSCDYWDDPATAVWNPEGRVSVPGPAEVAAAVVATVTAVMSQTSGAAGGAAADRYGIAAGEGRRDDGCTGDASHGLTPVRFLPPRTRTMT